ncbi:hypothetical protein E6H31_06735 [Candidatus Bathyarchaeota archaeon]|nr:MAG: hypothetical protein E6H31_06735 [Candidatus Bathyarchaeota archaeon]
MKRNPTMTVIPGVDESKSGPRATDDLTEPEKYIISERDDSAKRCNTIARTIIMGCKLLRERIIEYRPIAGTSPKDIPKFIDELDLALKESLLPDSSEHEDELREFLYDVRVSSLAEERDKG